MIEGFGPGAVLLREAPALIARGDMAALIRDLAEDLAGRGRRANPGAQARPSASDHRLPSFRRARAARCGRKR